jgi:hypothetical protein
MNGWIDAKHRSTTILATEFAEGKVRLWAIVMPFDSVIGVLLMTTFEVTDELN